MTNTRDNQTEKSLTSVMEDYLEAIFDLDRDKRVVRVKDIAQKMDVKMPTVSSMLKSLNDRGLVNYEKYEYVELTQDGAVIGKEMRRRHQILREFLTEILKIEFQTADAEACKMEHALSSATLDRLTSFMAFIQSSPHTGESLLHRFEDHQRRAARVSQRIRMPEGSSAGKSKKGMLGMGDNKGSGADESPMPPKRGHIQKKAL